MDPHRHLALPFFAPLVETVSRNNTTASIDEGLKGGQFRQRFSTSVDHPVADTRVCGPMRNQSPVHEPALVTAPVSDNDGNRRRSLFRGDVKARRVLWQIAVKVPADADIAKLEGSGEAATHIRKTSVVFVERQGGCQSNPCKVLGRALPPLPCC